MSSASTPWACAAVNTTPVANATALSASAALAFDSLTQLTESTSSPFVTSLLQSLPSSVPNQDTLTVMEGLQAWLLQAEAIAKHGGIEANVNALCDSALSTYIPILNATAVAALQSANDYVHTTNWSIGIALLVRQTWI